jgi:hypothetical protein
MYYAISGVISQDSNTESHHRGSGSMSDLLCGFMMDTRSEFSLNTLIYFPVLLASFIVSSEI